MLSVKATRSQTHVQYLGAGRQCVANSYAAMIMSKKKSPENWVSADLDLILDNGETLYHEIGLNGHLLVTDLPDIHDHHKLTVQSLCAGSVNTIVAEHPYMTLAQSMEKITEHCFLTIKCYTMAIIKENSTFYVQG